MFLTGEAQYPVERTLLTSGILEAALTSRYEGYTRLEDAVAGLGIPVVRCVSLATDRAAADRSLFGSVAAEGLSIKGGS